MASSEATEIVSALIEAEHSGGHFVLVTGMHTDFYAAYTLQWGAVSPGARALQLGVIATRGPLPKSTLERCVGLRAEVEVLAAEPTAERVVAAVKRLSLVMGEGETFQIHHEFVTECRHGHVSNAHLRKALYYAVEGPSATDATPREEVAHCFTVLELSHGYVFGRVRYAPPEPPSETDFKNKPKNYSAGLPVDLAGAAVMVGAASQPQWRLADEPTTLGGITVLDPCCGSGTVVFEAWRRGFRARGGDAEETMIEMAATNLAFFAPFLVDQPGPALELGDAASEELEGADTIVCNLPFGRTVSFGANREERKRHVTCPADPESLEFLSGVLRNLRPKARCHVFFTGRPLAPLLVQCGYQGVSEVPVCRSGRRYMSVCTGRVGNPIPPLVHWLPDNSCAQNVFVG